MGSIDLHQSAGLSAQPEATKDYPHNLSTARTTVLCYVYQTLFSPSTHTHTHTKKTVWLSETDPFQYTCGEKVWVTRLWLIGRAISWYQVYLLTGPFPSCKSAQLDRCIVIYMSSTGSWSYICIWLFIPLFVLTGLLLIPPCVPRLLSFKSEFKSLT